MALKLKRRCPGCFVTKEEDSENNDEDMIAHYGSDKNPSQLPHSGSDGCIDGDPVSDDDDPPEAVCVETGDEDVAEADVIVTDVRVEYR